MAGKTGKFPTAKTGRCLHAVELSPRHSNHAVIPKSAPKKIRLGPANKILLFGMIGRVWLNNETLSEIMGAGTKTGAVLIEIEFVGHVIERPDAMTLTAIEC